MMILHEFITAVAVLSIEFNFSITSWIRTKLRNKEVGGDPHSFHLLGLAVDCVLDNPADNDAFIRRARRLVLDAVDEGDHIHLEPSG